MNKVKFKDMPSKKNIRIFINERLHTGKIKKITMYNGRGIIFTVNMEMNNTYFCLSYGRIMNVSTHKHRMCIVYAINSKEYKYIINEIEFYRQELQRHAEKKQKDESYEPKHPIKFTVI